MRRGFELLYHQFAWAYDWVAARFFRGEWRAWQRAVLPRLGTTPGSAVLELGAGTGDLQIDLDRAGLHAFGVDPSPAMLRQARRKARRQGAPPPRLARARAQALPFAAAAFAAVVSTFPNEYIFAPATIAEIRRVLRPGGRLVVVPSAALLPVDRTARLLDRFAGIVYGRPRSRTHTPTARRAETLAAFRRGAGLRSPRAQSGSGGFRSERGHGRAPDLDRRVRGGSQAAGRDAGIRNAGERDAPRRGARVGPRRRRRIASRW